MLQRRGIHGSKNYQTLIARKLKYMSPQIDSFFNLRHSRGIKRRELRNN